MASNTITQISEEAKAAAEKSAALSAFLRSGEGKNLRIENAELWCNVFSLRNTYDELAKYLKERAKLEEKRAGKPVDCS